MFCAIVSLDPRRPLDEAARAPLRRALQPGTTTAVTEWRSSHAQVVAVQTGALNAQPPLLEDAHGAVCALAGEPLAADPPDVARDHAMLLRDLAAGDSTTLATASGTFCALHISDTGSGPSVVLATDRLGVRMLYHVERDGILAVSTSLPVLERLGYLDRPRDQLGILQSVALGCPLGTRTHIDGVYLAPPASLLTWAPSGPTTHRYFRWDGIAPDLGDLDDAATEAHRLFLRAVERRLTDERRTLATLSGGLDSRCVVASLRALGRDVVCLNRARENEKDHVYARRVADALDCRFVHLPMDGNTWFRQVFARHIRDTDYGLERPLCFWAGDGGSVCLGSVYLDAEMVALARDGRERDAARRLMRVNRWGLPWKLFTPSLAADFRTTLEDGICESLDGFDVEDRGQALLLFLLANDQHRHMRGIYDMEPEWGVGYQLPLFDGDLLSHFFRVPLDHRLGHRFYNRVVKRFAEAVHRTPWQVYPGHEPGEFDDDPTLAGQWEADPSRDAAVPRLQTLRRTATLLAARSPDNPVSPLRLAAAGLAHASGLRDCEHLLAAAERIHSLS